MRFVSCALAWALTAGPAVADNFSKVVPAGGSLNNLGYTAVHEDCTSMGYPSVRVTSGPSNGRVMVSKGAIYPYYPQPNPRAACNRRRVQGTVLQYKPNPGYIGSDSFTVQVIYPSGTERNDSYYVEVK